MFAKLFSRITESSIMEESITVRYCFVMMLAIADPEGDVIGTDIAIARRINIPLDEFKSSVARLAMEDPDSNSQVLNGVRLCKTDGERGYKVVNFKTYRGLKDSIDKRDYMRDYMRKRRGNAKENANVNQCKTLLTDVTQAEATAEATADKTKTLAPLGDCEKVYNEYPKRVGKPKALTAIRKALNGVAVEVLLERTKAYAIARKGEDSQFTPHPATWFNQSRFNDDPATWKSLPTHRNGAPVQKGYEEAELERIQRSMDAEADREERKLKADVPIDMSWMTRKMKALTP